MRLLVEPSDALTRRAETPLPPSAPAATSRTSIEPTRAADSQGIGRPQLPYDRRSLAAVANIIRNNPWSLIALAGFVSIWVVELYLVQAYTLVPPQDLSPRLSFYAPITRCLLDLLFVCFFTICLPRVLLAGAQLFAFVAHVGLLTYFHYFTRPISALVLFGSFGEGARLSAFGWELIPYQTALIFAAPLAAKLLLLYYAQRPPFPRRGKLAVAAICVLGYFGVMTVLEYEDPLRAIMTKRGVARLGLSRGYLAPWFAETYYLRDPQILSEAIDLREYKTDRLSPIEAPIEVRRNLIVIQAESLDYAVIGLKVGAEEVMPFLNQLRSKARHYRIRAAHNIGSCDADFTYLNGVLPSTHVVNYSLKDYPFGQTVPTTPQLLTQHGFQTTMLHGNTGEFYNRRSAYLKIGFDKLLFEEELEGVYHVPSQRWGAADDDVFRISTRELRAAKGPCSHFIITLTTHTPFTLLRPDQREIFKQPKNIVEHYLNNMRYLDNCLRDYVRQLKDATVVIYADHCTDAAGYFDDDKFFGPDRDGVKEYVPAFIFDTEVNLADSQKAPRLGPNAADKEIRLLDFVTFLRRQISALPDVANDRAEPISEAQKSFLAPAAAP